MNIVKFVLCVFLVLGVTACSKSSNDGAGQQPPAADNGGGS